MITKLFDKFYDTLIAIIDKLPEVSAFEVPAEINSGIDLVFQFVGWLMPYNIYAPLLIFILSLTAFRIVFAVYMRFKKN